MTYAKRVVLQCPAGYKASLDLLVEDFLRDGVALVAVAGKDHSKVEDIIDELIVGKGTDPKRFLTTTFRSAVDWWYYVVLAVAGGTALVAVMPTFATGQPGQIAVGLVTLLLAVGLPLWLLFSTDYRIDHQTLRVRSGPFRWAIPLSEISSVRESNSLLSSPALSLKRLEIGYGRGQTILLSPADRDGFLKAIGRQLEAT